MTGRQRALLLAVALALRLAAVLAADRVVADVLRYRKVADHILDVSWDPYQAPRLYPYPPVWVWVEAGSGWLARHTPLSFAVLVKLPVVAADLFIVCWLAHWGPRFGAATAAAWLYGLHPVSVLVTGFHGQFDALALAFVLLALSWWREGRRDASALALSAAIGLKSFPVLLLPVFLLQTDQAPRAGARFAVLAVGPVALLLVPYALHDAGALARELFGYGGLADFGWIGLTRGLRWLATGRLLRSEAAHWGWQVMAAKALFLAAYAGLLFGLHRRTIDPGLTGACLAVILAFLVFYGAVSAQYLLWTLPLGVLVPDRHLAAYSAAATLALLGFYAFLAPGVLYPEPGPAWMTRERAGVAWVAGVATTLVAGGAWLVALVRRGRASAAEARA